MTERRFTRSTGFSSAIPTAAPVADQPIDLSSPLALLSLTLPAQYRLAHISDTTQKIPLGPTLDRAAVHQKDNVSEQPVILITPQVCDGPRLLQGKLHGQFVACLPNG